jgi:hypothetical protein
MRPTWFYHALIGFVSSLLASSSASAVESPAPIKCEIITGLADKKTWDMAKEPQTILTYDWPAFGFSGLPSHYDERGLISDRPAPFILRTTGKLSIAPGEYRILLRYRGTARLTVAGKQVAETKFRKAGDNAHNHVPDLKPIEEPHLAQLPADYQEQLITLTITQPTTEIKLEAIVADQGLRPELGELSLSIAAKDAKPMNADEPTFQLLGSQTTRPMSELGWATYLVEDRQRLHDLNKQRRRAVQDKELAYWIERHARATKYAEQSLPKVSVTLAAGQSDIDQLIQEQLRQGERSPREFAAKIDDLGFLRRLALDTVGVIPSAEELQQYQAQPATDRRRWAIDYYLADPRWADHNVSAWQDLLAENPGILKPELNNSGPFRYWIYESLLDNKPMDRFATELVMMQGSSYYGGPAGFGISTQNDAPLAEKAHILAKTFLAVELKCARCHDAPYHSFSQQDTFEIAAMLARKEQSLPKSSTVTVVEGGRQPLITISLKPGAKLQPHWPFGELVDGEVADRWVRDPQDSRQRLAALITTPENKRFAEVIVNRTWQRLIGWGLVDSVDDWEKSSPRHPNTLQYLAREFVIHGYDLQHLQRMIFQSHLYQSEATTVVAVEGHLPGVKEIGPARRRLTAEQILDSLIAVGQRPLGCEELTFDPAGRSPAKSFHNLGIPTRAWQFVSLSNERDRPALSLPVAQTMLDVLTTFGWRESRQNPQSVRDDEANPLQPLVIAHGMVAERVATLSPDSSLTKLAVQEQPVSQLAEQLFQRLLTRQPTEKEATAISGLLEPGYAERLEQVAESSRPMVRRTAVSWTNHLSPEATKLKFELEKYARAGDPGTKRLKNEWREQMEDAVWAILNSPEFVFLP